MASSSALVVGHVAERDTVGSEVQPDEFHDALAADDVAAVVADDVDHRLREVLLFTGGLQIAPLPGFDDADQLAAVVVRRAADTALRTALRQARKDRFVLPVQHVEPAVPVEAALVVLIEAFEGVFDAREVRNTPVDSLEQVEHRQERAVEGGDVVIIERQSGCGRSDDLAVFDQLLDTADLRERGRHGADAPGPDSGGMGGEFRALPQAAAAHVHDHLESGGRRGDPLLGQRHPLLGSEHVTLARRTVDEHALQSVFGQHGGIGRNGFQIDVPVGQHRGKGSVDKSFDLFHSSFMYIL